MSEHTYQYVLWDFDGTLANTLASAVAVYNELASVYGYQTVTDPAAFKGQKSRDILKQLGIPFWKLPWFVSEFVKRQRRSMADIRLFPEIPEVLTELRMSGVALGIVSSNAEDNIRVCLAANQAEHYFQFIVGNASIFGKHIALRQAIARHDLKHQQVLYVGDEVRDIEAAHRVRIDIAAATWGWHAEAMLREEQPTYMVHAPGDLLNIPRINIIPRDSD